MAIIKAVSSKAEIRQALDYVMKREKTEEKLVSGLNCEPETVKDEMQFTKELWGKTGGRTYKHFVQSYHADEQITPEKAHRNAIELAEHTPAWKGFEVLIATHKDKKHIHSHFIVNSVNFEDGHKLQWSPADMRDMKERCNAQSREQGLHVPEKGKTFEGADREETVVWKKNTYHILKQAEQGKVKSYVQEIALAVLDCKETAVGREQFIEQMAARGYRVDWQDNRKYITFTDLDREAAGEKVCKIRNNKLSQYYNMDFGKETLEHEFEVNARREASREGAKRQLDRAAVTENSRADERERARQQLDKATVKKNIGTVRTNQPNYAANPEARLADLRSTQPSRSMEKQGNSAANQDGRAIGGPEKDLAEERLSNIRSAQPGRKMERTGGRAGKADTKVIIREARAGIDSSRAREANSGTDRAHREAARRRQHTEEVLADKDTEYPVREQEPGSYPKSR